MAVEIYDNVMTELTDTLATVYTCPAGHYAIVNFCQASNKDASDHTLDVTVNEGATDYYVAYNVAVPAQASLSPFSANFVLKAGNVMKANADVNSVVDFVMSVVEVASGA